MTIEEAMTLMDEIRPKYQQWLLDNEASLVSASTGEVLRCVDVIGETIDGRFIFKTFRP